MEMSKVKVPVIAIAATLLVLSVSACGVRTQQTAIRDARIAIAATGVALEASDKAAVEYFEQFPADDTEKYCQGEITTVILSTIQLSLVTAAESVNLWETSLVTYMMRKDGSIEQPGDWDAILTSQSQWMKQAVAIIAVLDMSMSYARLVGRKIPRQIEYAWSYLRSLTGKEKPADPVVNWGDLKTGVCKGYLPGSSQSSSSNPSSSPGE